ncbi:MAG: hypothetical protein JSR67_12825 [Proteobacteria bacterium]|nr:hypothetical protein [Pseudomonadota bacterium]
MVANLLNVLLGLVLVYSAVFRPTLFGDRPTLLFAAAACIAVAAWWARRSDHHPWQNYTNMLLGVMLAGMTALQLWHVPLTAFWIQFSVGTTVAILALWAALYRPAQVPT